MPVFSPLCAPLQAALKQDLADAMATCEELDQTVTDLTDDLQAKVQSSAVQCSAVLHVRAPLLLLLGQSPILQGR